MFCNLKLTSYDNTTGNILDLYNNFIKRAKPVLETFQSEEECEDLTRFKRRKLSVPDQLIRSNQLETDSAFCDTTKMYEPLSKTIFASNVPNNNRGLLFNRFVSTSSLASPYMSRSIGNSSSGLNRTPRTNRVRGSYKNVDVEVSNICNTQAGENIFKRRLIKTMMTNCVQNTQGIKTN